MGLTHFDQARAIERELGHLRGRWTLLGDAAGCVNAGVRRIEVPAGGWTTPAHEHGREEEIFFVLAGRGISWHRGRTTEVGEGDCIVYRAHSGAHTLHAVEPVDVLVFGPREYDESLGFPRLGMSLVGSRAVESVPYAVDRAPIQFVKEAELGPPELPEQPGPRPDSVVHRRRRRADPRTARPCGAHTPAREPCGGLCHHRAAARGRANQGRNPARSTATRSRRRSS